MWLFNVPLTYILTISSIESCFLNEVTTNRFLQVVRIHSLVLNIQGMFIFFYSLLQVWFGFCFMKSMLYDQLELTKPNLNLWLTKFLGHKYAFAWSFKISFTSYNPFLKDKVLNSSLETLFSEFEFERYDEFMQLLIVHIYNSLSYLIHWPCIGP